MDFLSVWSETKNNRYLKFLLRVFSYRYGGTYL